MIRTLARFARSETGAVTVDWTVVAASGTALGLAVVTVLSTTLSTVSDNANYELFGNKANEGTETFDFGAPGWEGAEATFVDGFGQVLGPIAGSNGAVSVTKELAFPEGLAEGVIQFDLLALDSLDNEAGIIYLNGLEVARIQSGWDLTWTAAEYEGIKVEVTPLIEREEVGAYRDQGDTGDWWWKDSAAQVTITIDQPRTGVTFGFGSTANQEVEDESWAIDNWSETGSWPSTTDGSGATS